MLRLRKKENERMGKRFRLDRKDQRPEEYVVSAYEAELPFSTILKLNV